MEKGPLASPVYTGIGMGMVRQIHPDLAGQNEIVVAVVNQQFPVGFFQLQVAK